MMAQYDSDLARLSVSNDISSVENKKKIEAEKALLAEKQKSEQKRQQELLEQKKRADADAKLEAERSIALKTQRDKMAQEAAAKAAEVRNLKIAKQGVLGQINIIESKKKALIEIRNSVEARSQELFAQLEKDRKSEEQRIRNKSYSTVEMENGKPTKAAVERREKQVVKSYEDLTNKFFADCDAVAQKKPNGYGFYDMSGNVTEWVWDLFYDCRCFCGGNWFGDASYCKVSRSDFPNNKAYGQFGSVGFRVVRTISK
ncbi:MAG: SUMF1/EgtB/PvdO family nonheme iron enzyme [Treponema sp.]|nr:SUMF1/EgtB/PvdO family nonheme iron enzyme [Treponema sp.]